MRFNVDRLWYRRARPLLILAPLAWLFGVIVRRRRLRYRTGNSASYRSSLPVIVVGNITVGGTGKSPLTAWLVEFLKRQGKRPVIVSRGYGGRADYYPCVIDAHSRPETVGDEPLMLARLTGVPVVVDPQRARAAAYVQERSLGDIIVCDDGLQHYALQRDVEIVVFDGQRGVGNGMLLPVGPLREPLARAVEADLLVANGGVPATLSGLPIHEMRLAPRQLRRVSTGETAPLEWLHGQTVHGVAGIGNPARFFDTLTKLGANVIPHPLPDHYRLTASDIDYLGEVVMTDKDAVKCEAFAGERAWALEVNAELGSEFVSALKTVLRAKGLLK
ncbi:tetraacyldisaccharide 4'-kinase [Mangrovitalea sediminis]|uniref:tetraacyldisaccharide 4'-kinase n=1 Tax=Mangrovitalea sediminis TaxID=1982043 RepID=UPI000BE58DF5|nr:tetraacyldisaccharide 4'-kinase [Mangrovitalea sediminis]